MRATAFGGLFTFIRNGISVKQDKSGDGLPITRIETISNGTIDPNRVGYAGLSIDHASPWLLKPGDLLFSHINSVEHIGKCAVYEGQPQELVHGMNLLCLRPDPLQLDSDFCKWLIRSAGFRNRLGNFVNKAVNQASVSIGNLRTIKVQIPDLAEQRRIAAILDQAEALRAKRRQALAKLDTLTQSLFISLSATSGASQLSLKDIVTFRTGKLDSNAAELNGQYPFFTCAKEDAYINTYAFDQEALLLAGNNAAGEYSVKHYKGRFNAYQRTYVISVDESRCTYEYVRYALQSQLLELKYQSKGTGTKYLTLEILNRLKLSVPSIQNQKEFSKQIRRLGIQEASILKSDLQMRQLQSSLKDRAFRGEL